MACTRMAARYPVSTPCEQLPAEPDLEPRVRALGLVPRLLDRRVHERVVEARPQPAPTTRSSPTGASSTPRSRRRSTPDVEPGRDPEPGRERPSRVAVARGQPTASLDRAQQQTDGDRDADRPRRRRRRARETGQQRLVGFEQDEGTDREREEQRVGVARAVEEPTRTDRARSRRPRAARSVVRGAARTSARRASASRDPPTHVTTISASGVLSIARASGRATSG